MSLERGLVVKKQIPLTDLDYHELLDRASVAMDHFFEYVESHQVAQANPIVKERAEEVTSKMYEFYNLCAGISDKSDRADFYEEED